MSKKQISKELMKLVEKAQVDEENLSYDMNNYVYLDIDFE